MSYLKTLLQTKTSAACYNQNYRTWVFGAE